jgi:hypothetical protein
LVGSVLVGSVLVGSVLVGSVLVGLDLVGLDLGRHRPAAAIRRAEGVEGGVSRRGPDGTGAAFLR